jgi:hypothetical protein
MEVKLLHHPRAMRLSEPDSGKPSPSFLPALCQYTFLNCSINSARFISPLQDAVYPEIFLSLPLLEHF